ncbi:MAG: hypothetical protein ACREA0_15185, partial [bacterium]
MTRPCNTPIVEALKLVAETKRANGAVVTASPHVGMCRVSSGSCTCPAQILVVSYRQHFEYLWAGEAPPGDRPLADWLLAPRYNTERTIVVIDDRSATPDPQQVLISNHVTPYDFAVALSLW